MVERVFLGNDNGTFKARVSKPGVVARNATVDQCLLHESMRPLAFTATGSGTIGNGGSASFSLGRSFSFPPVVVLRSASGRTPFYRQSTTNPTGFYAELNLSSGVLTIFNRLGYTDTFKYVVFIPA